MRDINDDMDDLFRRAADGYPLNTKNANWSKVYNSLHSPDDGNVQPEGKKKRRRFLWLLLLLPLGFVLNKYAFQNHIARKEATTIKSPGTNSSGQKSIATKKLNEAGSTASETKPSSLSNNSEPARSKIIENKKNGSTIVTFNSGKPNVSQYKYSVRKSVSRNKNRISPNLAEETEDVETAKNINTITEGTDRGIKKTENTTTNITDTEQAINDNTGKSQIEPPPIKQITAPVNNDDTSKQIETAIVKPTENIDPVKNNTSNKKTKVD